jgi:hypothetical protein
VQSIRIEPPPQDVARFTELAYIAKFIEILNQQLGEGTAGRI